MAATIGLIALVGPTQTVALPGLLTSTAIELPPLAGALVTLVAVVGFTNAFNFMDGIDGLAATQGAIGALVIAAMQPVDSVVPALALAACAAGFLTQNLPPARVFLGDVGSQYVGFLLGAFAVAGERAGGGPASFSGLIFLPFAVDATVTLARRLARGEPWHEPHRQHAYQRLVDSGWSHMRTTALYTVLTLGSGLLLLLASRTPSFGWLWWVFAAITVAVLLNPPVAWRRIVFRV